jgi:hypothetical protein
LNFYASLELLRKSKQSLRAAEKSQEKVEANGTGFSAEFFGSQSVEMICFARKTKIQMLTTSCWSLTSLGLFFLKSLRLYSEKATECDEISKFI